MQFQCCRVHNHRDYVAWHGVEAGTGNCLKMSSGNTMENKSTGRRGCYGSQSPSPGKICPLTSLLSERFQKQQYLLGNQLLKYMGQWRLFLSKSTKGMKWCHCFHLFCLKCKCPIKNTLVCMSKSVL